MKQETMKNRIRRTAMSRAKVDVASYSEVEMRRFLACCYRWKRTFGVAELDDYIEEHVRLNQIGIDWDAE